MPRTEVQQVSVGTEEDTNFFEKLAVKEEYTYETDPLTKDLEFFDLVCNIEDKDWVNDIKL